MSGARKLQTEIDRTLKKVEEGVEVFDEIWEKVYSATQQNQKEKYEVDLKKEIKKLQRHRDQIKTWVASSDIKDKRPLTDARKLIETKMEQFKVCEKETKTKTYSKEGLARETKVDPHEAAKSSTRDWLSEKVDALMTQIDMHEADMEKLTSGKGSKRNKAEVETLEASIKRHRWHIAKLEQIIRMLDNDALGHEQINDIKEDVEYYIEANQEPEFMDAYDETHDIFETLDLGDLPNEEEVAAMNAASQKDDDKKKKKKKGDDDDDAGDGADDKKKKKKDKDEDKKDKKKDKKDKKASAAASVPLTIGRATVTKAGTAAAPASPATKLPLGAKTPSVPNSLGVPQPVNVPPQPVGTESMANILLKQQQQQQQQAAAAAGASNGPAAVGGPAAGQAPPVVVAPMAARLREINAAQQAAAPSTVQQQQQAVVAPGPAAAAPGLPTGQQPQRAGQAGVIQQQQRPSSMVGAPLAQQGYPSLPQHLSGGVGGTQLGGVGDRPGMQQHPSFQQQQQQQGPGFPTGSPQRVAPKGPGSGSRAVAVPGLPSLASSPQRSAVSSSGPPLSRTAPLIGFAAGASLEPLLEVSDHASADDTYSRLRSAQESSSSSAPPPHNLSKEDARKRSLAELAGSMRTAPRRVDAERPRQYVPRNPYNTPAVFPSSPAPAFDDPRLFEKLGTDTLFFIFYFAQGTYQQFLAAKELKKQSWRYHKKYMTWFQRHEEPKATTDEYEQGTYLYFDYETGWCQRIKSDFTFEYTFLEDELVA